MRKGYPADLREMMALLKALWKLRPPDGTELGFTDNPHLEPERTVTTEGGIEQRWFSDRLVGRRVHL